jgi:rhodanese-related sulfurtransferase
MGAVRADPDPNKIESSVSSYGKDKTFVVYWAWPNEHTSARAVLILIDEGYTKAYALKGGWYEWLRAKYPVEKK